MRRWLHDNSLSLFFLVIFLAALVGQAIAGHTLHNENAMAHHSSTMSFWRYLHSSDFGNAVMENWQSEYLQFMLFMLATVWLVQRGSPESKPPGKEGPESDEEQKIGPHADDDSPGWARAGGLRTLVYSNSLLIVMSIIFFGSWFAQSVTGWTNYNADQVDHHQATLTWLGYIGSADFWGSSPGCCTSPSSVSSPSWSWPPAWLSASHCSARAGPSPPSSPPAVRRSLSPAAATCTATPSTRPCSCGPASGSPPAWSASTGPASTGW